MEAMQGELDWIKGEMLGEDEMRRASAQALGIPFVILSREDIMPEILSLIPEPISRVHNMVAYRAQDGAVEVALLNIADLDKIDFLNLRVRPRLTNRHSIKHALLLYQKILKEKFAGMVEVGVDAADSLLRHALHNNASHIHLEPAAAGMLIRYRIRGVLHEAMRLPQEAGDKIAEHLKSLAKLFPVSTTFQEGRFKVAHGDGSVAVHVSTVPTARGEKIHLRLARERQGQTGFTLQSLGFHGVGLERLHEVLQKQSGVLVVCGPEGSGKTTTLYTLLDEMNAPDISIATIEKTIEYHLPHVAQTRVRPDVGLTTVAGLRALLRKDNDVVMVGDIDSADVVALMTEAAKRNIFMLGAVENIELVENIGTLINQRLVKKLCPYCKESYKLSRQELDALEGSTDFGKVLAALKEEDLVRSEMQWKEMQFCRAVGCDQCEDGYLPDGKAGKGKIGIQEIIDDSYKGLNLIEEGLFKAAQGLTSVDEIIELAQA
jgi:type IV pilus assembly protein PilB